MRIWRQQRCMQWLSDACVLLDCEKLVSDNYTHYQSTPGQFSVQRPYQCTKPEVGSCADCGQSAAAPEGVVTSKDVDQTQLDVEEFVHADTVTDSLPDHTLGKRKRKRKGSRKVDPQKQRRLQEAQQRHDTREPVLLAAFSLLQQHYSQPGTATIIRQATTSAALELPGSQAQHDADHAQTRHHNLPLNCEPHDSADDSADRQQLDLLALHELKYALHPKFQFSRTKSSAFQPTAVNLFDKVISNSHEFDQLADAHDSQVLIPPHASFLMSDIKKLQPLLSGCGEGYQCIVLDPPWENKSAKRGNKYPTLPSRNLLGIPLRQLMHKDDCLVALWVTNKERHLRFIHEELLPHWEYSLCATWYWLKITCEGQLTSPLDVAHRRPYEVLMLLRPSSSLDQVSAAQQPYNVGPKPGLASPETVEQQAPQALSMGSETLGQVKTDMPAHARDQEASMSKQSPAAIAPGEKSVSAAISHNQQLLQARLTASGAEQVIAVPDCSNDAKLVQQELPRLHATAALEHTAGIRHSHVPDGLVMMAVPGQHSRKPQLAQLLQPYLPADAMCLEMFARELNAGWASWGNQVLHFQQIEFFQAKAG